MQLNREKDGIPKYKQYLIDCGIWSEELDAELQVSLRKLLDEATEYGDKAPFPTPESTLLHVYAGDGEQGGQS
ncbi:hypothetical protein D3C79_1060640 [compost metagenome]